MKLEMTTKEYRRLLDMVYIGNWVLNATRGEERFEDYDWVESLIFSKSIEAGMPSLVDLWEGTLVPSKAFTEGGIHEAIIAYENNIFFDILAEDLARRDMAEQAIDQQDLTELTHRMQAYIAEFEAHGTDNIQVDSDKI